MNDSVLARWERHNEAGKRLLGAGDLAAAEQAFIAAIREATLLGADNERLATSLSHLGQIKFRERDLSQAEALLRRSLAIRERTLGDDHVSLIPAINNLASVTAAAGELSSAEPLFRRALALSDRHLGERHPGAAAPLNSLARLYLKRSEFAAAEPLLHRLLAIKEEVLGPRHAEVATILTGLARARLSSGDAPGAEEFARRALTIREQAGGAGDPLLAATLETLADVCDANGKAEEAAGLRARSRAARPPGGDDRDTSAPRTRTMPLQPPTPIAARKLTPPFGRQVSRPARRTPAPRDNVVWVQPATPNADVPSSKAGDSQLARRPSMPLFAPTTLRTTGSMSAIVVPVGSPELFTAPAPPEPAFVPPAAPPAPLLASAALAPSRYEPSVRSSGEVGAPRAAHAGVATMDEDERGAPQQRRSSGATSDATTESELEGPSFRFRHGGISAPQWLSDPRRPWLKFVAAASVVVIVGASVWAFAARGPGEAPPKVSAPVTSTEQGAVGAPATAAETQRPVVDPAPAPTSNTPAPVAPASPALDRMATATLPDPHGGGKSGHQTAAKGDSAAVPSLPSAARIVGAKLDRVADALDKRASARADSLGRSVTIKPPSFGKP